MVSAFNYFTNVILTLCSQNSLSGFNKNHTERLKYVNHEPFQQVHRNSLHWWERKNWQAETKWQKFQLTNWSLVKIVFSCNITLCDANQIDLNVRGNRIEGKPCYIESMLTYSRTHTITHQHVINEDGIFHHQTKSIEFYYFASGTINFWYRNMLN